MVFSRSAGYSELHQKVARRSGAPIAQTEVIFRRPAFVAVAFHVDRGVGEIGKNPLQSIGVGRKRRARVVANVVGIVIEKRILQIGLDARFQSVPRPWFWY